jgi:hypothetical protein
MNFFPRSGRRELGGIAIVSLSAFFLCNSCLTPPSPAPEVRHVVLIWQSHPGRSADRAALIRAAHSLQRIPGVVQVETPRSVPSLRPDVRQDYDLAVVITFRDRAALLRYENDPRHFETMRRYLGPLVRHYEIYNLTVR